MGTAKLHLSQPNVPTAPPMMLPIPNSNLNPNPNPKTHPNLLYFFKLTLTNPNLFGRKTKTTPEYRST